MSLPYLARIALIGVLACFLVNSSVSGQGEKAAERAVARELSKEEASHVLGVPEDFIESLGREKSKIPASELERFRFQFGRLENGLPTFQVARGVYFVLIPLDQLAKQAALEDKPKNPVQNLPPMIRSSERPDRCSRSGRKGNLHSFRSMRRTRSNNPQN